MEEAESTARPEPRPLESDIYVAAALLCDNVLIEKDDTVSIIRVVDRLALTVTEPDAPEVLPAGFVPLTGFVTLRSERAGMEGVLRLDQVAPDGHRSAGPDEPFVTSGDHPGVNVILDLMLRLRGEGRYWLDVVVNERVMSRMPLRIVYQRLPPAVPDGDPTE